MEAQLHAILFPHSHTVTQHHTMQALILRADNTDDAALKVDGMPQSVKRMQRDYKRKLQQAVVQELIEE